MKMNIAAGGVLPILLAGLAGISFAGDIAENCPGTSQRVIEKEGAPWHVTIHEDKAIPADSNTGRWIAIPVRL